MSISAQLITGYCTELRHTDLDILKSGVNGQAGQVCFISLLFSLRYLFNICCSFQIFLKTSTIQSHSADDSLVVWTLQNSFMWDAKFVQSPFHQAVLEERFVK